MLDALFGGVLDIILVEASIIVLGVLPHEAHFGGFSIVAPGVTLLGALINKFSNGELGMLSLEAPLGGFSIARSACSRPRRPSANSRPSRSA